MKASSTVMIAALALLAVSAVACAQAPEREMQTGVKTTGAGWATIAQITIALNDLPKVEATLMAAFEELWTKTAAAGLTPLGPGHIVMLDMPARPPDTGDELSIEVQIPFVEQPTEADLDGVGGVMIVPIDAAEVAYTYYKAPGPDLETAWMGLSGSFMRLYQWLMASGYQPVGGPRIIVYTFSEGGKPEMAELQVAIR